MYKYGVYISNLCFKSRKFINSLSCILLQSSESEETNYRKPSQPNAIRRSYKYEILVLHQLRRYTRKAHRKQCIVFERDTI